MPMNIPTFLYMKISISLILWRTFWYIEFLINSFCLSTLKMLFWCLLASLISEEKSSANHIVPLQVIVIFSCYYQIFSLSFALEVWLWGNLVRFSWYFTACVLVSLLNMQTWKNLGIFRSINSLNFSLLLSLHSCWNPIICILEHLMLSYGFLKLLLIFIFFPLSVLSLV